MALIDDIRAGQVIPHATRAAAIRTAVRAALPYSWTDGDLTIRVTDIQIDRSGHLSVLLTAKQNGTDVTGRLDLPYQYRNPPLLVRDAVGEFARGEDHFRFSPIEAAKTMIAQTIRLQL